VCEVCQLPFTLTQTELDEKREPKRCTACQDV
jgi:hypothetical protein